jgi:hypothetical protein
MLNNKRMMQHLYEAKVIISSGMDMAITHPQHRHEISAHRKAAFQRLGIASHP